jgi:hypothetical protein
MGEVFMAGRPVDIGQTPVRQHPISLRLEVVEIVPPRNEAQIALGEPTDPIVEADAGVRPDQPTVPPVTADEIAV